MSDEERPSSFAQLTPQQKDRLRSLVVETRLEKMAVSFSIDSWDNGRRKSAFYSVTAFKEGLVGPAPYTLEEAPLARCVLSRHVVLSVYDDAIKRGIIPAAEGREEARAILKAYETEIVRTLGDKIP